MTNAEIEKVIDQYVDGRYFYKEKLLKYLANHQTVGNEVFEYCDRGLMQENGKPYYSEWLDKETGYIPLVKESFVQRIPFYFYVPDKILYKETDCKGSLDDLFPEFYDSMHYEERKDHIEKMYQALIYLFYNRGISLYDIFNYCIEQTGVVKSGLFKYWVDYVRLCDKAGIEDYLPDRFITAYNILLENAGREPIVYRIHIDQCDGPFRRSGTTLTFEGSFPCDDEGRPILKWIGMELENVKAVSCTVKKSEVGYLNIEITPTTRIDAYITCPKIKREEWRNIFMGAKRMSFDYSILKKFRIKAGYTQKEVADAIGANVRTYQKWENGNTTPDCQNLIRLVNWLDIRHVQEVIRYD